MGSSYHPSVSTVVYLGTSLILAANPTTLLSRFPYFSTYLDNAFLPFESRTVLVHLIESSGWNLQIQYHSQIIWIWSYLLFCYLSSILYYFESLKGGITTDPNNTIQTSFRLIVILINPLAFSILPRMQNYASFFNC